MVPSTAMAHVGGPETFGPSAGCAPAQQDVTAVTVATCVPIIARAVATVAARGAIARGAIACGAISRVAIARGAIACAVIAHFAIARAVIAVDRRLNDDLPGSSCQERHGTSGDLGTNNAKSDKSEQTNRPVCHHITQSFILVVPDDHPKLHTE